MTVDSDASFSDQKQQTSLKWIKRYNEDEKSFQNLQDVIKRERE